MPKKLEPGSGAAQRAALTPESYVRISAWFERAIELPEDERAAFLSAIPDPADRHEVESLLAADLRWPELQPALISDIDGLVTAASAPPPATIGPYRIIRRIADGGMGQVFEAEQDGPLRRRVALKLIARGLPSHEAVLRFRNEIRAMALMEHPHIAKAFDAGLAEDGRPYFVMELVAGTSLIEFCDRHPADLRARLELFLRICRAVQHAHQKGIVHRDLKPSNILVDLVEAGPVPKVIDFGIAKAIEPDTGAEDVATEAGSPLGTAHYMSPEQVTGGTPADTRTDVYALGVLLYRLLSGTLPFARPGEEPPPRDEVLRRIRDDDPVRPSERVRSLGAPRGLTGSPGAPLVQRLANDLDWVVLKALEKDVERRYGSAAELASDLERFLRDEPVSAGRPAAAYRLRKWLRRHRMGAVVAASAAIVAVLGVGGLGLGLLASVRAERQARWQLFETLLAQVRPGSEVAIGQREALARAVEQAAALLPRVSADDARRLELRNAAIRSLTAPELRPAGEWVGFPDGSRGLAFNADLSVYARGDETGRISIRDAVTDRELFSLPGAGVSVWALEFSPDGSHLLAAYTEVNVPVSPPFTTRLWRLADRAASVEIAGAGFRNGAFDRSGGRFVAVHADGSLAVHRTADGGVLRRIPPPSAGAALAAAFLPAGDLLALWEPGGDRLRITRPADGLGVFEWRGPGESIWAVQSDQAGRFIAAGGASRAYLFDRASPGAAPVELPLGARVDAVSLRAAGSHLFVHAWDDQVHVFETTSGRELFRLPGSLEAIDRSDRFVIRRGQRLLRVDWIESAVLRTFAGTTVATGPPTTVSHHPVDPIVATATPDGLRLWSVADGREIFRLRSPETLAAAFDPSTGDLVVASAAGVTPYAVLAAAGGWRLEPRARLPLPTGFTPQWVGPDAGGLRLAVLDRATGHVAVIDRRTGTAVRIPSHPNTLWVELSPDGRTAVTASWNAPGVAVWDATDGARLGVLEGTDLATRARLDFSRDNAWLATYTDRPHQVCLWRTGTWERHACRPQDHPSARPGRVAFDPASRLLAVSDPTFGFVRLLDAASLAHIATVEVPAAGTITAIAFSPDGLSLAMTDAAARLHVLDIARVRERLAGLGLDWGPPARRPNDAAS